MANEVTLSVSLNYVRGKTNITVEESNLNVDVTGDLLVHHVQNVGFASEEALDLGGVTAGGYMFARNLDATNFVSIRSGTGATNVIKLKPGEVALFRLSDAATAPFAIADTAAVDLEYLLLSD